MNYRVLGRTGIKVSEIGMGCEGFSGKPYEECEKLMDHAIKNGINFFDVYTSDPVIRQNMGKALNKYARNSFIIQGHLCSAWKNGQYFRTRNIDEIKLAFANLLMSMQVDYVDIGMIHYSDDKEDLKIIEKGPIKNYAEELKANGLVKSIGISTHNPEIARMAVDTGFIDVIMFSINPAYDMLPATENVDILFENTTFDRVYEGISKERSELYKYCQSNGVAITVMKAFAGGLLFDKKQSPFGKAMTPVQCISYCLDRPAVSSVLGGMANTDEIDAAVMYGKAAQKEKDYSEILANAPKTSFNGHCMYCGHCAPCSAAIDIAAVNKYLDLVQSQNFISETLRNHYELLPHHAGECIECQNCESNCPFGVDIVDKMKQAKIIFGK